MIKLLKQTSEYYITTENEADRLVDTRKKESAGLVIKRNIETKDGYFKVTITEEFDSATELSKKEILGGE